MAGGDTGGLAQGRQGKGRGHTVSAAYPLGFTYLLASSGAALWWTDDERQPCPLVMAANQGNWRQLAVGLYLMGSGASVAAVEWSEVIDALSDAIVQSSCLSCTMGAASERCDRCRYGAPHSSHCDFEKCIDVLVYFGLRLWQTCEGLGCSADKKRALAWRINERYRCRITETRGANLPSTMVSRAFAAARPSRGFASPSGMGQYIRAELDEGAMSQSVHDVLASALASGVRTQAELVSEWRPKVLAAVDQMNARSPCVQCESDAYGVPPPIGPAADAAGKRTSMCQRCRSAWYCSVECQKAHWKAHKFVCNKAFADCDAIIEEALAARGAETA